MTPLQVGNWQAPAARFQLPLCHRKPAVSPQRLPSAPPGSEIPKHRLGFRWNMAGFALWQGTSSFIENVKRHWNVVRIGPQFFSSSLSAGWITQEGGMLSSSCLSNSPTGTRAHVLKQILVFQLFHYLLLWGLSFHCIQHKVNGTWNTCW